MTWKVPAFTEDLDAREANPFAVDRERPLLAPIAGLDESWWPTATLERHVAGRTSWLPWRRRRAIRACRWLIVRREVAVGVRKRSMCSVTLR